MRILVTYASKYGTTKRYAQWIAEDLACDLRDSREVNAELLKSYDILIHGGGLYAGGSAVSKPLSKITTPSPTSGLFCFPAA